MGQKVHPKGFRLGIYQEGDARWFEPGNGYGTKLIEDLRARQFLEKHLERAEVARVEIERAGDNVRVIIHSGRPGTLIGRKGQEIEGLRSQLSRIFGKKNVEVTVQEVKKPELDATLVAKNIAAQLVKRGSYKSAMKRATLAAMKSLARGVKIAVAGRLNGAEIARTEYMRVGSLPLHTLRSNVDYGFAESHTTYGVIGVKVWICKGDYQRLKI